MTSAVQRRHEEDVVLCSRGVSFAVRVPSTDIDRCIPVTPWRSCFTIFAIILAITDIPRTGLTFRLRDFYKARVAPHSVMYWGPYEYHVVHLLAEGDNLNRSCNDVNASRSGKTLDSLEVWPYKHDTLSIAQRAVAQELNVASYPPCILYHEDCRASSLNVATVFNMLDDLVGAVVLHWFPGEAQETTPFIFFAKSNWVDRLNHYVVRPLTKNPENRLHSVYYVPPSRSKHGSKSLHVCRQQPPLVIATRPIFCDHPIRWKCDHPIKPTGERNIAIWDHIDLRFDSLQRQNPNLDLDITMLVSTFVDQTHCDRHVLPTVSYTIDTLEVTTFIRGRKCDAGLINCRTVFIDDFRYERSSVESNEEEWKYYLWLLRGGSQLYVWIRVGLLIWGCYHARRAEPNFHYRRFLANVAATCRTIVKIPGHTIVYGSWIPIIGYAVAHFFDSSVVHFVNEFQWSSVGGLFDFNPIKYIIDASVQMRNIWMIALIWKCGLLISAMFTDRPHLNAGPHFAGILALRGGWIGVVSWLATFGFARALSFRDTNIVSFTKIPRGMPFNTVWNIEARRNYADAGIRLDLKCSFVACMIVVAAGCFVKLIVRVLTGCRTSVFTSRSFYVPFSAGSVWSKSTLQTVWGHKLRAPTNATPTYLLGPILQAPVSHRHKTEPSSSSSGKLRSQCDVCSFPTSVINWRPTQGCIRHEPIFDVHHRTTAIWSMVRLTNIANMTEPLVLFNLYVLGKRLFVHKVTPDDQPPYLILLPTEIHLDSAHIDAGFPSARGTQSPYKMECMGSVDSRDVPWHVLVQCG